MISLKINKALVTPLAAEALIKVCPFSAITYEDETLDIGAGCRMCKLCVKKGPEGVVSLVETHDELVDKSLWNGVCVYAEAEEGTLHPVTFELIGKARELAAVTKHEVYALLIGHNTEKNVKTLLEYGVDRVYVYDYPEFADFVMLPYSNAFEDFIERVKPSSVLVGATNVGRSLAPRIAARFRTGLTADCTALSLRGACELHQTRPAFGGNVMAEIVTKTARPQMCTVRYRVFDLPERCSKGNGRIIALRMPEPDRAVEVLRVIPKPLEKDLSEAEAIIAVGRGCATAQNIADAHRLACLLGAQVGCTRPLVETGQFDPKRQIGLSGRTVKPKYLIALGISGSVQFAAGMSGASCIIAVNHDPSAPVFGIAHMGLCCDAGELLPEMIRQVEQEKAKKTGKEMRA